MASVLVLPGQLNALFLRSGVEYAKPFSMRDLFSHYEILTLTDL